MLDSEVFRDNPPARVGASSSRRTPGPGRDVLRAWLLEVRGDEAARQLPAGALARRAHQQRRAARVQAGGTGRVLRRPGCREHAPATFRAARRTRDTRPPVLRRALPTLHIAHRGGGGLAPENTMIAFEQAARVLPTDNLELDVQLNRDGELERDRSSLLLRSSTPGCGWWMRHSLPPRGASDAGSMSGPPTILARCTRGWTSARAA